MKRTALVIIVESIREDRLDATKQPAPPTLAEVQSGLFTERYNLCSRNLQEDYDFIELAIAGEFVVGRVIKFRVRKVSPKSYFGKGQTSQIESAVGVMQPDCIVTNAPLSPVHQRNLEEAWKVPILTRADIIFDIFEMNAKTSEGKLQVELAQLHYRLPRLIGVGRQMSRAGGDMGTRGGGGEQATRIQKDRIRKRIRQLEGELENIREVRELRRKQRVRGGVFTVTLIGYTNSGKSSLINALTKSSEEVAERYFTTLDPAARSIYLGEGINAVICDTVGFLDDLPPELLTAFRATMEEVAGSDLLLHVVDASQENIEFKLRSGLRILEANGLAGIPRVVVLNKADLLDDASCLDFTRSSYPDSLLVSAATGRGLPALLELLRRYATLRKQPVIIP